MLRFPSVLIQFKAMNIKPSINKPSSSNSSLKRKWRAWLTPYQIAEGAANVLGVGMLTVTLVVFRIANPEYLKWIVLGIPTVILSLLIIPEAFLRFNVRKKGLLAREPHESSEFLNQTLTVPIPLTADNAWESTKENLGEIINARGILRTHWEVEQIDESNRNMQLSLRYIHDPVGKKPWQIVARTINCKMALKANGVNSKLNLEFNANSPMDDSTVKEIIEKTKLAFGVVPANAGSLSSYIQSDS